MKLKNIEIRVPEEFNKNCTKVQFYLHQISPTLLTLKQTDNPEDNVFVKGEDLLTKFYATEMSHPPEISKEFPLYVFIIGTTETEEPFIFEPYQDLILVTKDTNFNFKGCKNANRI